MWSESPKLREDPLSLHKADERGLISLSFSSRRRHGYDGGP